jgi:hypothetical protein
MSAEDGACLIAMASLLQMKVELAELDHMDTELAVHVTEGL